MFWKKPSGDQDIQQALRYFNQGDWAKTVAEIEKGLKKKIKKYDEAQIYAVLGFSLSKMELFDNALEAHKKSIELDKNNVDAWHYYGVTLRKTGDFDEAEVCYEKALQINPRHELTLSSLGALYIFREKPQKAIEIIKSATAQGAQSGISLGNLALAYAMVGRFEDADHALNLSVRKGYKNWKELERRISTMKEFRQGLHLKDTDWLPIHCQTCGAPVSELTVQWITNSSALCGFCGSKLKPE